jgi:hypothetical protein
MRTVVRIALYVVLFLLVPTASLGEQWLRLPTNDAGVFDPAEGPVTVGYRILKDAREISVLVEDFRGKVIERLYFVDLRAGVHSFSWKGGDDNGQRLPDGRYRFLLRVQFTDGGIGHASVAVRIATLVRKKLRPLEPLPPKPYGYAVDGSVSAFWRKRLGHEKHSIQEGEYRARVHLAFEKGTRRAEGVFSMNRPYGNGMAFQPEDDCFSGSWALAEQRWLGGKLRAVFRESLGSLGDPLRLFSDFRSERNKVGTRIDQRYGWLELSALGFFSDRDVESKEKGIAGRMSFGPKNGVQLGVNYAQRRAISSQDGRSGTSEALSSDLRIPAWGLFDILMECAGTEDHSGKRATGYLMRIQHDSDDLRISGGFIDLGEYFSADFSDPLHGVIRDARGIEFDADYLRREPFWMIRNAAMGMRCSFLRRPSSGERVNEVDLSLRAWVGQKGMAFFNWFAAKDGPYENQSLLFSLQHRWNSRYSSSIRGNFATTGSSHTRHLLTETTLKEGKRSYRLSLEWIRRAIEGDFDSPYTQAGMLFDMVFGPWTINLSGWYNKRYGSKGFNFFLRIEHGHQFLHRYRIVSYVALGDRAAFETEKQVEAGVALWF